MCSYISKGYRSWVCLPMNVWYLAEAGSGCEAAVVLCWRPGQDWPPLGDCRSGQNHTAAVLPARTCSLPHFPLPSYIGKASRGQKTTCLQEYHGGRIRPLFWSNDKILCSSTKTLMAGKKLERLHLGLFSSRSLNKLCFDVSFSYEFKWFQMT